MRLVGLPRGCSVEAAMEVAQSVTGDATFHIYVRISPSGGVGVAWATTVRPVTFERSEHEDRFLRQVADDS